MRRIEDKYEKYIQLSFNLFFTFLGFLVALILTLLGLRLLFGLVDSLSWFAYFYMVLMIMVPPALFITIYWIYIKRTLRFPFKGVRLISLILLSIALLSWLIILVMDVKYFFEHMQMRIEHYYGYNVLVLFLNILCIFGTGIMQALAGEKEKDWMEKRREREKL